MRVIKHRDRYLLRMRHVEMDTLRFIVDLGLKELQARLDGRGILSGVQGSRISPEAPDLPLSIGERRTIHLWKGENPLYQLWSPDEEPVREKRKRRLSHVA